jgi:hypothetical protein
MFRYAIALATLTFSFNAFAAGEFVDIGSVRVAVDHATQRFLNPYIDSSSTVEWRVKSETQTDRIFEVRVVSPSENPTFEAQVCSVDISVDKKSLASQPASLETCKFGKDQEAIFNQIQKNFVKESLKQAEREAAQQ